MPTDYKSIGKSQSGDPNIMKLKEINKVRPLDNIVAGWRQHGIQHPSDPEQFESVVCPGARSCPLCRKPVSESGKQHFPVSKRFAANVWDYDTKSVKVLVAGPKVFDELKAAAMVGIDPASCDWTITKSGSGLQTAYQVIRHDVDVFTGQITPDMLHSVDKYEQPDGTEKIFEKLEKFGIDYDSLTIPSFTLQKALEFTMPYTKHKGMSIEQLVTQEQSYAEWMHSTKLEQGQLGDPVFLALQTVMEDRGLVPSLDEALLMLPEVEPESPPESAVTVTQAATNGQPSDEVSASSLNMVKLVGPEGNEVMVPPSAVDALITSGFKKWEPPALPTDANAPTQVLIGGQEVTLPREQALALIESGTAQAVEDQPASEPEPEKPSLPLPDELVQISIAGTEVPMMYVEAAKLVDAGTATFVNPEILEAHQRSFADEQATANPPSASSSTTSSATSEVEDAEKPFACNLCTMRYKTQGGLTQHKNREHKSAEPQPSAVPSTVGPNSSVSERVKDKIARAPFARDFTRLVAIFEEETKKRNFGDMDESELLRVEARIDKEIAAAAD